MNAEPPTRRLDLRTGMTRCPAHKDRTASLSIRHAGHRWLLHCFAGCLTEEILRTGDLAWADLFDDVSNSRRRRPAPDPTLSANVVAEQRQAERVAERLRTYRRAFQLADVVREAEKVADTLRRRASQLGDCDVGWRVLSLAAEIERGRQIDELAYEAAMEEAGRARW